MKCVVAVLCSAATWQTAYAAQPEHSTSPSRQFVIYGAGAKVRGAISGLAEQTKTDLLGLLRQRDDWKTPVVINLQSQQSNLPELRHQAATRPDYFQKRRRFTGRTGTAPRDFARNGLSQSTAYHCGRGAG